MRFKEFLTNESLVKRVMMSAGRYISAKDLVKGAKFRIKKTNPMMDNSDHDFTIEILSVPNEFEVEYSTGTGTKISPKHDVLAMLNYSKDVEKLKESKSADALENTLKKQKFSMQTLKGYLRSAKTPETKAKHQASIDKLQKSIDEVKKELDNAKAREHLIHKTGRLEK
jgi:hypothetical protein